MRVLYLCYRGNPHCGGQGIYIYHLTRELAKLGVEADVIVGPPYPDPMDEWSNVYPVENLNLFMQKTTDIPEEKLQKIYSPWNFLDYVLTRFHIFPEMETFSFRAFSSLKKLLKNKNYDIIHDVQSLGWGVLPMKSFGMPIITTVHHPITKDRDADLQKARSLWDYLTTILFYPIIMQRIVINKLDRVITSSREGVGELEQAFGLQKDKISVVFNGMDVRTFKNTGAAREDRTLLFVGNTEDTKKGITYLLEAMMLLPEDVTLTICDGGPPYKFIAYNKIKELKLENRVSLIGKVELDRLVHLYSTATILVMPSLHEGFGLPAAEAMACETPVVAMASGALKEVISDDTGILVPTGDTRALADAILKLLKNKKMRKSMGKKGRKRAEKYFDWPVAARNTLDVYEKVIEQYRSVS